MFIMESNKKNITDGLIEGILGGEKKYSTGPKEYSDAAVMCAQEFLKAIEARDPKRLISSFLALKYECEEYEKEEDKGELELEIKL